MYCYYNFESVSQTSIHCYYFFKAITFITFCTFAIPSVAITPYLVTTPLIITIAPPSTLAEALIVNCQWFYTLCCYYILTVVKDFSQFLQLSLCLSASLHCKLVLDNRQTFLCNAAPSTSGVPLKFTRSSARTPPISTLSNVFYYFSYFSYHCSQFDKYRCVA